MGSYKIDDFWCDVFCGVDKVVFIFMIFIIYYNDDFFFMDGFDC